MKLHHFEMKTLQLFAVFFILVLASAEDCSRSYDCAEDECCVATMRFPKIKGKCKKIRQEGEDCFMPDRYTVVPGSNTKVYHFECPCVSGLECEVQDYFTHGPYKIDTEFRCVAPRAN